MTVSAVTPTIKPVRKTGILRSWHPQRAFGIIKVGPESSLERYFLHVNAIRTGTATPSVGMSVEFEPGPIRKEGDLPPALKADIIMPAEETPAVTGTDTDTTASKDGGL
jgi:cold shock CspA family protein